MNLPTFLQHRTHTAHARYATDSTQDFVAYFTIFKVNKSIAGCMTATHNLSLTRCIYFVIVDNERKAIEIV